MILFSDFDRTFYFEDNDEKNRANFEAIQKWRAAGHQFCITTGRSFLSVTRRLPQISEISDYYIVDGGSITLSKSATVVRTYCFEPETVAGVVRFTEGLPEKPVLFYYAPDYEGVEYKDQNITKLRLWFKDLSLLDSVARRIEDTFPVFAFICNNVISRHEELEGRHGFVEVIPKGSGKSRAIRALGRDEQIPIQDIITIGDDMNDYDMVQNFDGFAIEGSNLAGFAGELKTAASVASLVDGLLGVT